MLIDHGDAASAPGFVAFTWCASAEHIHDAANLKSASRQGQPWRLTCF
jgi:hypothetical protein